MAACQTKCVKKKEDHSNPGSWRGITLRGTAAKHDSSIVTCHLTKHVATFGVEEQCRSMFGKGCTDAAFMLLLEDPNLVSGGIPADSRKRKRSGESDTSD